MVRDRNDIPQGRVTQYISEQHHLSFSDELQLERFSDFDAADHFGKSWRIYLFVLVFIE